MKELHKWKGYYMLLNRKSQNVSSCQLDLQIQCSLYPNPTSCFMDINLGSKIYKRRQKDKTNKRILKTK